LLVDGYALIARRSDHGLGEAWLAQRPHQPDDEVVVKFLAPVGGDGLMAPKAFEETMRRVQRATSPGLVSVRRWGVAEGWLYAVTEVIEARPLEDWLAGHRESGTRPPPGVALWLFDGLCGAVQSAHRQGVVHGALSPRSVLLHPLSPGSYHGWILDLGVAPWVAEAAAVSVIEAPPLEYQSPEQVEARGALTPQSDVFTLALLCVELLTLTATPGSAAREPMARVVARGHDRLVEHLKKLRDDVHEDFWAPLAEALRPDPARRPEGAQQLKARVRAAAHAAALWRDVPEPVPEPPAPKNLRSAAPDAALAARSRAVAPEGWMHAERLPARVEPEVAKGMLSVAARRRRATAFPDPVAAPIAAAVAPPMVPTFAAPDEQAEGTVRAPSVMPGEFTADVMNPTFSSDFMGSEGSERRPSLVDGLARPLSEVTLLPSRAWGARVSAVDAPAPVSPPRRARSTTRGLDEAEASEFFARLDDVPSDATVPAPRAKPPGFEADAAFKAPRGLVVTKTEDVSAMMHAMQTPLRPSPAPPPLAPPVFAHARQGTMPPPSYAPPPARYGAAPPAEPFVLRPPDGMPVQSSGSWWVLVVAAAIVLGAATVAALIVFA
jgi:serine/threonine-protein kinase